MLNQERVCEMTRLAIFDQKEGEECRPMIQYFCKDYIAKEMIKSMISGTLAFAVIVAAFLFYNMEKVMEKLSALDIQKTAVQALLCYAGFMGVYLLITYIVYYIRYTKGRQRVKKYYMHLKRVNKLYREEET